MLITQGREILEQYITLAKDLKMINAKLISPVDIYFDIRALLKCRWGCEEFSDNNIKCNTRNTSFEERVAMIKNYNRILLVHSHDANKLSNALLEIERAAFLDGHYFAFAIRYCHLCKTCIVEQGKPCPTPNKIRPCGESFGIDVYKTAWNLGLPCQPLKSRKETRNWYGFVLID